MEHFTPKRGVAGDVGESGASEVADASPRSSHERKTNFLQEFSLQLQSKYLPA
jgi:hypothetical protein